MIPRKLVAVVQQRLSQAVPAVVLLGPRQVGKTTLARQIAAGWSGGAVYLDLELPSDRRRLDDAESYLRGQAPKLVVIDEIHRAPELFAVLRGLIDERRAAGQRFGHFLLLGSAALDLMRQSSESLAGRVAYLWTMLAHQQGGLLNQAQLGRSLSVSAPTMARYVDLLSDLQLVRRLMPWSANVGKRLVKSPKVYVRDSGLVHALLGLRSQDDVLGHPVAGPSWEGLVVENLVRHLPAGSKPWFYRTHEGAEIDLLIERGGRPEIAIEVKRSTAPSADRGFGIACDDLDVLQRWVVYPGTERFPLRQGAQAIGLAELSALLAAGEPPARPVSLPSCTPAP